jgi:hypothetical protein
MPAVEIADETSDVGVEELRPGDEPNSAASALLHAILRLESVIDEEITALQSRRRVDYEGYSRRKNRGLLELVRSWKGNAKTGRDPRLAAEVGRLRSKLHKNRALLQLHFNAVQSVAEVICRSLREAESDGTYAATSRMGK